jgi:enoyl-CoA hydratase/carnithine racemase
VWEEVLGLNRARHLIMTGGSFTAAGAGLGRGRRGRSLDDVLTRAETIAAELAAKPQLLTGYIAVTIPGAWPRGTMLGLALESLSAVNLPRVQ